MTIACAGPGLGVLAKLLVAIVVNDQQAMVWRAVCATNTGLLLQENEVPGNATCNAHVCLAAVFVCLHKLLVVIDKAVVKAAKNAFTV